MRKRRMKRREHMVYKNNFWNQLRKERGISFSALGKILNCSTTAVRYYFMGYRMPSPDIVQKLCEGFDVDFEKGMQEFKDMYKAYKAGHKTSNSENTGVKSAGRTNAFKKDPNNFWKCKIQAAGKTYKDVVNDTGLGYSSVQTYFRGVSMPSKSAVKTLCDYFSVDYGIGYAEFEKIYNAAHTKESDEPIEPISPEPETYSIPELDMDSYILFISSQADEILKQLYNKLTYAEFKNVAKQLSNAAAYSEGAKSTSLLESIYNVVDCPTFVHIVRVLDQEVEF